MSPVPVLLPDMRPVRLLAAFCPLLTCGWLSPMVQEGQWSGLVAPFMLLWLPYAVILWEFRKGPTRAGIGFAVATCAIAMLLSPFIVIWAVFNIIGLMPVGMVFGIMGLLVVPSHVALLVASLLLLRTPPKMVN